jgi:hypothetical protein
MGMAAALGAAGCAPATPTAQKAAGAALAQLGTYEVEVQRKIKAENDYYEAAMDAASQRVEELWEAEQPFQFEKAARSLTQSDLKTPADRLGPRLIRMMETLKDGWVKRDTKYAALLAETEKTLLENRRKLELERGKIRILRNKLKTLGTQRSNKEMLALSIAFAKEVKEKYDEIGEAADKAAGAARKTDTTDSK